MGSETTITPTPAEEPKPATPKTPALPVTFDPDDAVALYMDVAVFAQLQRVARLMCSAGLVPAHLRGEDKLSDCALVAAQAFRWRMDPFAIAQHTFVLSGKLGYEGKLIAAVVNTHSRVERHLDYAYSAEGQDRKVVVSGRLRGEEKDRTVEGRVRDWATANDQWKKSPDQMLAYRGAREWARRHVPEAVLGVSADEEVRETVDLERGEDGAFAAPRPALEVLTERLKAQAPPPPATCSHPDVPPSAVSALKHGETLACEACGEALVNPDAQPPEEKPLSQPPADTRKGQRRLQE
jgi:hypothetical protein